MTFRDCVQRGDWFTIYALLCLHCVASHGLQQRENTCASPSTICTSQKESQKASEKHMDKRNISQETPARRLSQPCPRNAPWRPRIVFQVHAHEQREIQQLVEQGKYKQLAFIVVIILLLQMLAGRSTAKEEVVLQQGKGSYHCCREVGSNIEVPCYWRLTGCLI